MKTAKYVQKILNKRKESSSANVGFIGGFVAGVITAVFSLAMLLLNRQLFFQELASSLNKYGIAISIPNETVWILSLIVIPPIIILVYSITGIFLGLFLDRFERKSSLVILSLSILLGFVWGLITDLPVSRLSIELVNVFAWLFFGVVFIVLGKRKSN
jgi:hypothetical protein